MRSGRAIVGTSGWIYKHWNGRFYPPGLPARRQLAHMASCFDTVEVNGTFYGLQRPSAFEQWRRDVPAGFVFALKGSRYLTHMLKLKEPRAPLANFFAQGVLLLGAQLGPLLWQLPPRFRFEPARARAFLELLPRDLREAEALARQHDARLDGRAALRAPDGRDAPLRHALEVREPSWLSDASLALLAEHDVALVAADTAERYPKSLVRTTRGFAYVRLHGARTLYASRYTDDELDAWAATVTAWTRDGSDTYVYFDNDDKAYAPDDARRLIERLERSCARHRVSA